MRGILIMLVLGMTLGPALSDDARLEDAKVEAIYSERFKNVSMSSCDVFLRNDDVEVEYSGTQTGSNWAVTAQAKRSTAYAPHFGLQYSTLRSLNYRNQYGVVAGPQVQTNLAPQVLIGSAVNASSIAPQFSAIRYVEATTLVVSEFFEHCGMRANCRCILEGKSQQAVLAQAIQERLLQIEPYVAAYVRDSFVKMADEIAATTRDQLFNAIVNVLDNRTELTNRVVDAVIAQLGQTDDQRLVTLISQRLASDARLREGIEQIVRNWIRRNPR